MVYLENSENKQQYFVAHKKNKWTQFISHFCMNVHYHKCLERIEQLPLGVPLSLTVAHTASVLADICHIGR